LGSKSALAIGELPVAESLERLPLKTGLVLPRTGPRLLEGFESKRKERLVHSRRPGINVLNRDPNRLPSGDLQWRTEAKARFRKKDQRNNHSGANALTVEIATFRLDDLAATAGHDGVGAFDFILRNYLPERA
jgi:hypothetical protein